MLKTLEGKKLSDEIKAKVKKDVAELKGMVLMSALPSYSAVMIWHQNSISIQF
jgi:hypothetical protein